MALSRVFGFKTPGQRGQNLALTDSDLVSANATGDTDFTMGIGRKADTAGAGAVTSTNSLFKYIKQIVNLLLGTRPGSPIVFLKTSLVTLGTGGVAGARVTGLTALSGAVGTGTVHLKRVVAQVKATAPTGAFTALYACVVSGGVIVANVPFVNRDGSMFTTADAVAGAVAYANCGHLLAVADVISVYTESVAITGTGPTFTVEAEVVGEGATLVGA